MGIGKKLLSLRKQKGISQQDLASYLHISRQTVSKFEHDLSLLDMDIIIKICEYYQVNLNELLGIENSTNDITELYNQIQLVAENMQKNNKKSKILNFVLIIICVISLGLSLFMVTRIQYYENMFQSVQEDNNINSLRMTVNQINSDNQIFINEETFMETKNMI